MAEKRQKETAETRPAFAVNQSAAPTITLPKGGGALRSIDEKFSVNAANGSCEFSIPLPFSKTRSGLDSSLAIHYSSGSGNGAFGLGWGISLPSIQRRTDKQLPRYGDASESDVFLFSGAEDLVPSYVSIDGKWIADAPADGVVQVERYRPRVEGMFARIEKITIRGKLESYWKVTTRDNTVTIFGRTKAARIFDPKDPGRIFRWLPEWAYDDKGNCVEFVYKDEDLASVPDVVEEGNRRSGLAPIANKYLKRIRYGNKNPYFADPKTPFDPAPPGAPAYFYETVFDYGEHDDAAPSPEQVRAWPCRFDPFSDYRAGFEVRTYRLCRRALFFHYFSELEPVPASAPTPCLVRSLDFDYRHFGFKGGPDKSQEADFITGVRRVHYKRTATGIYERRSLPKLEFTYHELAWNRAVKDVSPEDVVNAPAGVSAGYQWLDLYGEGVPGIFAEQAAGWHYKSNLGDGHFSRGTAVASKPSFSGVASGALQFQDLDADGSKQLVSLAEGLEGYFDLTDDNDWLPFRAFEQMPTVDFADPNTKFIDLDGDGRADLLISEESVFRWYPSLGRKGYDSARLANKPFDEEVGPAVVFADGTQTIFIADMSGDGLGDIVRIRNCETCYWPNLGYGRFGAKVTMRNAPVLDLPEHFDPRYIQLADVSGTGAMDLIYLGRGGFVACINHAGNAWSDAQPIDPFPGTEFPNRVSVVDLLGNGTACLVWSSPLPANAAAPLRYVDLMGGRKPYIMSGYRNNLGKETHLEYRSSSHYALLDKREGHPWVTKLPFPTMCLSRMEVRDSVSGSFFVHEYRYRHGYYDHAEREFRGFGMVESKDTETFDRFSKSGASNVVDSSLHQPPVRTRTWYHTGAFINGIGILRQFAEEYLPRPATFEHRLLDARIDPGADSSPLTTEELRQAARACKGMVLRQEVYADDGTPDQTNPYSAAEHNCYVRMLQPMLGNRHAVFLVHESEAVTYEYERNLMDPRITHSLNTAFDEIGIVLESAAVVYGRIAKDIALPAVVQDEQARLHVTYSVHGYTRDVTSDSAYRLRQPCESRLYELTGARPSGAFFDPATLKAAFGGAASIDYEKAPTAGVEKRLIQHERSLFASDSDVNKPLALGILGSLGLHYEGYALAFTPSLFESIYGDKASAAMLAEGKYVKSDDYKTSGRFPAGDPDGHWWVRSGHVEYSANPEKHFYLPDRHVDPFGSATEVHYYSDYHLLIAGVNDAVGNETKVRGFDFRLLQPQSMLDANGNITDVSFDMLGLVVGTAVRGKGEEADDLDGFVPDLTAAQIGAFLENPAENGAALLAHATSRFVYSFDTVPTVAASIVRETHHQAEVASGIASKLQYAFEYSDGLGNVAMRKIQAEPGKAKRCDLNADGTFTVTEVDTTPHRRWVGNGRAVLNNKGKPVMQFEPYFSVTHAYETAKELVCSGVTPVFRYDPVDRLVRTDFPDGTFAKVAFDSWKQSTYDQNDTVLDSDWHAARIGGALGEAELSAAKKAAVHADTPALAYFDSLGRAFYIIQHNRFREPATGVLRNELYATQVVRDIEGNERAVIDARGRAIMRYDYDMLGRRVHHASMDAGERWMLNDVGGKPIRAWDSRGHRFRTEYDALRRPVKTFVRGTDAARSDPRTFDKEFLFGQTEYGEGAPDDTALNLRTRVVRQRDGAGVVASEAYDFKGNPLATRRQLAKDYKTAPDWSGAVSLEDEIYRASTTYDALNRAIGITTPHTPTMKPSVIRPSYNESNLLERVEANLRGAATAMAFVTAIDYDAKGQRTRVDYGNRAVTTYEYDQLTFRLRHMSTKRDFAAFPDDCPAPPRADRPGCQVQNLRYTYDPVGNITHIRDDAQQAVYFRNARVEPATEYTYDAIYRLIEANGREHLGQGADGSTMPPTPTSHTDVPRINLPHPGDRKAMGRYVQQYLYDEVGNILAMRHRGTDPAHAGWKRCYQYAEANNRLLATGKPIDPADPDAACSAHHTAKPTYPDRYEYDDHGNITAMPHLPSMQWDFGDQLRASSQQVVGAGTTPQTTYYVYDAGGQRVRKVTELSAAPGETPRRKDERIYLGGFEVYRSYAGPGTTVKLERETLHVMDDKRRVALVETKTVDLGEPVLPVSAVIRYQLDNHLGSACVELDDGGAVISYEEYYPYGSTSYQAGRSLAEVSLKRYRYTGKERDEESGLYYHGARYYAPWLGRWTSTDPGGIADGVNLYLYVQGNPITLADPSGTQAVETPSWMTWREEPTSSPQLAHKADAAPLAGVVSDLKKNGPPPSASAYGDDYLEDRFGEGNKSRAAALEAHGGRVIEKSSTGPPGVGIAVGFVTETANAINPYRVYTAYRKEGVAAAGKEAFLSLPNPISLTLRTTQGVISGIKTIVGGSKVAGAYQVAGTLDPSGGIAVVGSLYMGAKAINEGNQEGIGGFLSMLVVAVVAHKVAGSSSGNTPAAFTSPANATPIPGPVRSAYFDTFNRTERSTLAGTAAHKASGARARGADFFRGELPKGMYGPEKLYGPVLNEYKTILSGDSKLAGRVAQVYGGARAQSLRYSLEMQAATGLVPIRTFTFDLMRQNIRFTK